MIRRANPGDAAAVTALALRLWPEHGYDELKSELEETLKNGSAMIALYLDGDAPAGFAHCQLRFDYVEGTVSSPVGYLEGIFVDEAHRGAGAAGELLKFAEEWARGRGCTEFASDCELGNTASYGFHLHSGFTEANRIICFTKKL